MNKPSSQLRELNIYEILQIFSIDIVLGAGGSGIFAWYYLSDSPLPIWWFIMPLSVWIVYTTDHLIDGFKRKTESKNPRHYFHYKYRKIIIPLVAFLALVCSITALLYLPLEVIFLGFILGSVILIYFIVLVRINKESTHVFQKEMIIALIYTIGVWGTPVMININQLDSHHWVILFSFFFLAWVDMLIYASFELPIDKQDDQISFPLKYGIHTTSTIIYYALSGIFLINIISIWISQERIQCIAGIIIIMMAFLLFMIQYFRNELQNKMLYRLFGEAVFMLPIIYLLT